MHRRDDGRGYGNDRVDRNLLAAKLQSLSFSREQEYEADTLGLRYMIAAGYDPGGAAELLRRSAARPRSRRGVQGRKNRQIPEWALTHPLSENRMQRAIAGSAGDRPARHGIRNRDAFLNQLEGMYVDDDPAQGIIDGPVFTHPDLRIQFRVPPGYLMSNGAYAVTIAGSAGKAQFSGGRGNGIARQLHDGRVPAADPGARGKSRCRMPSHTTINGMPAAFTTAHVNTDSGVDRRERRRLSVGPSAYLPFRHADPGRNRARPVRAAGELAAENHARRRRRRSIRGSSMS